MGATALIQFYRVADNWGSPAMTHPLLPSSNTALKQRLLTGASATVIVLALAVAAPTGAMAQTAVTADVTRQASVAGELAQINAGFEHDGTANDWTVTIDLNDTNADLGTLLNANTNANALIIDVTDASGVTAANTLSLTADAIASNNGTIAINVGNGTVDHVNFEVNANILEQDNGVVTIVLGDGVGDPEVGLTFDAGAASQTVNAEISVVDDGDVVSVVVANSAGAVSTTTFTDRVILGAADTITVGGAVGTTAIFQADVTAPGGIDVTAANSDASLVLGAAGAMTTVTADIDLLDTTNTGTLTFVDGSNVTLIGDINAMALWDAITIGNGSATTLTLRGSTAGDANLTLTDNATLIVDTTGGAMPTLAGDVLSNAAGSLTTLRVSGDGPGGGNPGVAAFDGAVGANGNVIDIIDLDDDTTFGDGGEVFAGDVDVATGVTATFQSNNGTNIIGNLTGEGTVDIGNADGDLLSIGGGAGTMSTVSVANLDGQGSIDIVDGSAVTITTTIGDGEAIHDFTSDGANTVLTINSGANGTQTTSIIGDGLLTLDGGTIVLGQNIGAGDTVFDFDPTGTFEVNNNVTTTVQLSANFLSGALTFVDFSVDESLEIDGDVTNGELVVTDTALTDFGLNNDAEPSNIVITATARTAADTANLLGVSTDDANALRQAVISTDATGDTEGYDALTTVLNAGLANTAGAALAARTVGTQEDTLGGASEAAFQMFGQQTGMLTARLEDMRGQSGFAGGDLDAPYSPQAPSSMGGIWGQAFGGVANADGDTNFAGWDAAYGGMMVGLDGRVSEDFTLGAFGSYSYTTLDGDGAGNSEIEAGTVGFGVYAGYAGDGFYLDGFAAYAVSQNDLTRTTTVGALTQTLSADYDLSQLSVGISGGVPMELSSNVFITPNASLTWNNYDADTYTETGGSLAQTVNSADVSNLTGTIGARIHAVYENFDNDGTVFIPELRVALIGDLVDDDATAMATFAGAGVTAYQVTGTDTDDVGALVGIGLGFDNADWSASLNYDADLRSDFMSHTARAEFRWKF